MDSVFTAITSGLITSGFGGIMVAVIVYFGNHLVTKVIPTLLARQDAELAWTRAELAESRRQFLEAIAEQRKQNMAALDRLELRWEKAMQDVIVKLNSIEDAVIRGHRP